MIYVMEKKKRVHKRPKKGGKFSKSETAKQNLTQIYI